MHNIDRTVGETSYEYNNENYELNPELINEGNYEYPGEFEYNNESLANEYGYETQGELNEIMEMELASELLNVSNEAELEQFLGSLFKKVAGGIKNFARSSAGKALGGMLKGVAKKALPVLGGALGSAIPIPGVGTALGSALGTAASNLFELELEGLSNEDKEFEVARAYVRFAKDATKRASRNPRFRYNPAQVAKSSVVEAARRHAPGLLKRTPPPNKWQNRRKYPFTKPYPVSGGFSSSYSGGMPPESMDGADSGTLYRDGNQIILNM